MWHIQCHITLAAQELSATIVAMDRLGNGQDEVGGLNMRITSDSSHAATHRGMSPIALVAPLFLAGSWILITKLPNCPLWIATIRVLSAGLVLLVLRPARPTGVWWVRSCLLGSINFAGFFSFQAAAVHAIPAGVAATIAATQTLLVPFGAVFITSTPLRSSQLIYAAIGVLGITFLVLPSRAPLQAPGFGAAAATAVCSALGLLLTRRWGQLTDVHHLSVTSWQMIAGGLVLAPVAVLMEGARPPLSDTAIAIMTVIVISTAMGFAILFGALRAGLSAASASRLMLLCPLAVTGAGWVIYGQSLSPVQLLGALLVIVPIAIPIRPPAVARRR